MPNTPVPSPEIQNEFVKSHVPRGRYYPTALPTENMPQAQETGAMQNINVRDLLDVLLRRWVWMLLVILVVLGLGIFRIATTERLFASSAEAMVRIKDPYYGESQNPALATYNTMEGLRPSSSINTQIRYLRSYDFLKKAFARLPEEIQKDGMPSVSVVNSDKDTNVITFTAVGKTPRAAAAMANAVVQQFIEQDREESSDAITTALKYIKGELDRVSGELTTAQNALATFQTRHGKIGEDGKLAQLTAHLTKLETDSDEAIQTAQQNKGLMAVLPSKLKKEDRHIVTAMSNENNPVLDKIDAKIYELEATRADRRTKFVPGSPELQEIEDAIKTEKDARTKYLNTRIASKTTGVNPLYQQIQQDYLTASTAAAGADIRRQVLRQAIGRLKKELANLPSIETRGTAMRAKVEQLDRTHALLSENYQTLRISEASKVSNVRQLSGARENPSPVSPNIPRNIIIALVFGLMLAVGLAALLETFDDRVHSQTSIERISHRPLLAHIPKVPEDESPQLIHGTHGRSSILEGMRLLRSNLAFAAMDKTQHVFAVTSPGPSEGKTTTAINLAVVFALDGKRVVLVDADLRRPSLHNFFGLERKVGLTSVATGNVPLDQALQPTFVEGISLLTTGPLPPNPPEVLNAQSTRQVFADLQKQFDVVIIDTPPAAGLSDVPVISTLVDGIIFVVSADQTHRGQLQMALHTLEQIDAPILGFILNKIDTGRSHYRYYYYYYYHYYNYNYGAESEGSGSDVKKKHSWRRRRSAEKRNQGTQDGSIDA